VSIVKVTVRTVTFTLLTPYNAAPHNRYQPHPAEVPVTFTLLAPYNAAPHNRYQPHPAEVPVTFTLLTPYKAAPHNRYQPHPAVPAQHTTCSNTRLGLLKMGIMMPETC